MIFLIVIYSSCSNPTASTAITADTSVAADSTFTAMLASATNPAYDTAKSVTIISPRLYKELADTLNIRMVQGIYKPGDSSILHAHPDCALYVLESGTVEFTAADGKRDTMKFTKNSAFILPATSHSVKNIGRTTLRLLVIEANRPRE